MTKTITIEPGKSYRVRRDWYRVVKIENGKVHCLLGDLPIAYEIEQFVRMVTR